MPKPTTRPSLRRVALPTEHGGWGLTLEPGLLGVLVAPGVASAALLVAALLAFLIRTPMRTVLVDMRRGRWHPRTTLALRVAAVEGVLLAGLVTVVASSAEQDGWWLPAVLATPLVAVELWFDVRSRSRELVPEMLGAIAVASVVAIAVLADGGEPSLAYALWLVLAARVVASIPHVRALIKRLHARSHTGVDVQACDDTGCPPTTRNWTTAGLLAATAAVGLSPQAVGGTAAVITLGVVQEVIARQPPRPAKIVGIQQTALGMAVVLATAAGVWFS